jgi:GNAT superfamily N-acetyltransferase
MLNPNDPQNKWWVREYTPQDRQGVFELRKAVYGAAFGEEEWNWKVINETPGRKSRIFVAEMNGLIVGMRPIICTQLKAQEHTVTAGQNVDMMVHPDYRKLGIFTGLVDESIKKIHSEGINIILSFPNENSYPGLVRNKTVKWHHVSSIPLLAMPLDFDALSKSVTKSPILQKSTAVVGRVLYRTLQVFQPGRRKLANNINLERISTFDDRFDQLWRNCSEQFALANMRNSKYLQWRYFDKPEANYVVFTAEKNNQLAGYIVLNQSNELFGLDIGLIMDMLSIKDNQVINALLSQAIEYFKEHKAKIIGSIMLPQSIYSKAMKKSSFIEVPKRFSTKEFYFMVHTHPNGNIDDIAFDARNWYITFGDDDII